LAYQQEQQDEEPYQREQQEEEQAHQQEQQDEEPYQREQQDEEQAHQQEQQEEQPYQREQQDEEQAHQQEQQKMKADWLVPWPLTLSLSVTVLALSSELAGLMPRGMLAVSPFCNTHTHSGSNF